MTAATTAATSTTASTSRRPSRTTMRMSTAVGLELRKLRRLWIWPITLILVGAGLALSTPLPRSASALKAGDAWPQVLLGIALITALISPILLAVLASRLTDVEHTSGGWTMSATAGLTPGRLCRAKLVALSLVLIPVVALQVGVPAIAVKTYGVSTQPNMAAWAGYAAALLAVDMVACGLHILASALIENQIVCVGVGFLGSFIAVFSLLMPPEIARLIPWGYWAVITPVKQVGDAAAHTNAVVYAGAPWLWIGGFCLVAIGIFWAATARLDRIER